MAVNFEAQTEKPVLRRRLSFNNKENPAKDSPDVEGCKYLKKESLINDSEKLEGRSTANEKPRYIPSDWDDTIPYGGKVYLARRKKPDSLFCVFIQVLITLCALVLLYYGWYHTDHFHFHATKLYATLGHKEAQALIGHKLLHGNGVEKNHTEAMVWLYEAAKQGHPHAAYNVAVGHLQGIKTALEPGEARIMIEHAANNGVMEAVDVLQNVCSKGHCDI